MKIAHTHDIVVFASFCSSIWKANAKWWRKSIARVLRGNSIMYVANSLFHFEDNVHIETSFSDILIKFLFAQQKVHCVFCKVTFLAKQKTRRVFHSLNLCFSILTGLNVLFTDNFKIKFDRWLVKPKMVVYVVWINSRVISIHVKVCL